jgi:hypothetical protein
MVGLNEGPEGVKVGLRLGQMDGENKGLLGVRMGLIEGLLGTSVGLKDGPEGTMDGALLGVRVGARDED